MPDIKWDYYTYKTWYATDENGAMFTFSFINIDKGHISGEYSSWGTISSVSSNYYLTLDGTIKNGKAVCELNEGIGYGVLKINSFSKDKIEAELEYDYGLQDREFMNGVYTFYPLSVDQLNYPIVEEDMDYTNINGFGDVRVISYEVVHAFIPDINTFLVDENNLIVFQFKPDRPPATRMLENEFIDVNGDRQKDFIILYEAPIEDWSIRQLGGMVYLYDKDEKIFKENKEMSSKICEYGLSVIDSDEQKFKIEYLVNLLD